VSYRSRLSLFFALIVIVPMIAVTVLVVQLSGESRTGKADARLASDLQTALVIYRDEQAANRRVAQRVARDVGLAAAVRAENPAAVRRAVSQLARKWHLTLVRVTDSAGKTLGQVVSGVPVGPATLALRGKTGTLGSLSVSAVDGSEYVSEVHRLTAAPAILSTASARLVASAGAEQAPSDVGTGKSPSSGNVELSSGEVRRRTVPLTPLQRLTVLGPLSSVGLLASQPLLVAVLILFFLLAITLILPLLRDLQHLHDLVEQQAITDELTGLSNQRRFRELMAKEVERSKRFDRPLSLVMMDIDDFKDVNDTYGHLQGDHVLREVAALLRVESREIDEPARYGGEEFALALPETTMEGAVELAERIRRRLEKTPVPLSGNSTTIKVTASFGVAGTPETEPDATDLVAAADKALYEAKRLGKNQTRRTPG
jgi:diguanylate cyclase (GGDEF)-like protein